MSDPKKSPEKAPEPQLQARTDETAAIASAVTQKTLEAILPSLMQNLSKGQAPQAVNPSQQRYVPRESKRRCDVCGWHLDDKTKQSCDEHESVVLYPTNEDYAPHFLTHGLILGGVKFMSEGPQHRVPVPKGAKDTLLYMLQEYERAEKEMRTGRTRKRNVGTVSPAGVKTNPTSWE
jgi:hypothetical protein